MNSTALKLTKAIEALQKIIAEEPIEIEPKGDDYFGHEDDAYNYGICRGRWEQSVIAIQCLKDIGEL
jgi:hypothetical protein